MSVKIMDINDLSDSREVMAKKIPPATTVFICFVAMMLIAAFIHSKLPATHQIYTK